MSLPKLNENQTLKCEGAETVAQTCSVKKVSATLLKKRLWHRCFPVNFAKFLRTPFFYRTPLVAVSEGAITESELLKALTSKNDDKSPGNDGITKEPLWASIQ